MYYLVLLCKTFTYQPLCFTVFLFHTGSVLFGAEGDSRWSALVSALLRAHYTTRHPACGSLMYIYEAFLQWGGWILLMSCWGGGGFCSVKKKAPDFSFPERTRLRLRKPASRCRGWSRVPDGSQRARGCVCARKSGLTWDLTRVSYNLGYIWLTAIFWTEWMREWCLTVSGFPSYASL